MHVSPNRTGCNPAAAKTGPATMSPDEFRGFDSDQLELPADLKQFHLALAPGAATARPISLCRTQPPSVPATSARRPAPYAESADRSVGPPKDPTPRPVLKWAGGKTQLLPHLVRHVPERFSQYIEPFFGGGALFFALRPVNSIISDSNPELINLYRQIADDLEGVIEALTPFENDENQFYEVRALHYPDLDPVTAAARTIYLNRTCFNGLYRLNRKGEFNVPFGKYENPRICNPAALRAASNALKSATILEGDYRDVLRKHAQPGDFIYLDPPYLPTAQFSDFQRYTASQFHEEDHYELADEVKRLIDLSCHVILTNSNHPLVYDLYEDCAIQAVSTKRNINSRGDRRIGTDVILTNNTPAVPDISASHTAFKEQVERFPSTRYMGSKEKLIHHIWNAVREHDFHNVLDLFSGTGVVSYMFKAAGKQVLCNDHMTMCEAAAVAMIENNTTCLENSEIDELLQPCDEGDDFVQSTFPNLYFSEEDNKTIDSIRANIARLGDRYKRAIALSALVRACVKKRPRGVFTFVGNRYDDGRKDLVLSIEDHFRIAADLINSAVFDNGQNNQAWCGDAMTVSGTPDLVYIDPPYFSPLSDNEYVRRYHFVEGISRDWQGVEIQWHTKTRKFRGYPTPFSSYEGARSAFEDLFRRFRNSILVVSYSSNALPQQEEIAALMARYKHQVRVVSMDHRYSFGNQAHKIDDNKNRAKEYLFIGS